MAMDLFVLRAVLGLDTSEYEKGLERSGKQAGMFGQMLKANLVTKGVEVAVAGMKKLGNAAVSMVKQSVDAFAEYEQLVGGVETLFKGSADTVKEYAQEAYRTAGLSANEYMETVTGFSASLIQSLGGDTKRAAEFADMAIRDMSDNANKMGSSMESIQTAYQGFSRGQFQLLDNLKLGYGGTKQEMDRLIKDAMKLNKNFKVATKTTKDGKKANQELSYSYADIVQAIHIVQENMEITGTTAKEAEHTISGSLNMVKASWKNLITAMAEGNTDKIDKMVDSFVDSAEKYANNLFPVVEKAIEGLATLIERLAPKIEEKLPGILERITPTLIKVTGTLIKTIATVLTSPETIRTIFEAAKQVVSAVFGELKENNPELLTVLGVGAGIKTVSTVGKVAKTGGKVVDWVKNLFGIGTGVGAGAKVAGKVAGTGTAGSGITGGGIASAAGTAALAAFDAAMIYYDAKTISAAYKEYKQAGDAFMAERAQAIETYRNLVKSEGLKVANEWAVTVYGIASGSHDAMTTERMIMHQLEKDWGDAPRTWWDGLKQGWEHYFGKGGVGFRQLLKDGIFGPVVDGVEKAWGWGKDLVTNFADGIKAWVKKPIDAIGGLADKIKRILGFSEPDEGPLSDFHTYAPDMMKLFAQGISDNAHLVTDAADKAFNLGPRIGALSGGQEFTTPVGGDQPTQINLILDDTVIGRVLLPILRNESNRVGVSLSGGAL